MPAGVRGRLISDTFIRTQLQYLDAFVSNPAAARTLAAWSERVDRTMGPASSVRAITDAVVVPLLNTLEYDTVLRTQDPDVVVLEAMALGGGRLPVVVCPWDVPIDAAWRTAVLNGVAADTPGLTGSPPCAYYAGL